MLPKNHLIIAVDFDGTIVENTYPKRGKPIIFAFETLKKLQAEGHRLILWTYRDGKKLKQAVDFCSENGIDFYAVNKSYPEEIFNEKMSRKIHADIFIDDRNIGGLLSWTDIYVQILNHQPEFTKKKGFLGLFRK